MNSYTIIEAARHLYKMMPRNAHLESIEPSLLESGEIGMACKFSNASVVQVFYVPPFGHISLEDFNPKAAVETFKALLVTLTSRDV